MKRDDYIAALIVLLTLLERTRESDNETNNGNYLQMVQTLDMFLPCEVSDGDITPIRTTSNVYLDRIRRLYIKPQGRVQQLELCQEWTMVVMTLARGN